MSPLSVFSRRSACLLRPTACPGSVLAALVMVLLLALPAVAQTDPVPPPGADATRVPLMTRPAPPTEPVAVPPEPTSTQVSAPTPTAEEPRVVPRDDVALNLPARISGNTAVY